MGIFSFFRSRNDGTTAKVAKDRLQVLIAHERSSRDGPDFLPMLRQDIMDVIRKYVPIGFTGPSNPLDRLPSSTFYTGTQRPQHPMDAGALITTLTLVRRPRAFSNQEIW